MGHRGSKVALGPPTEARLMCSLQPATYNLRTVTAFHFEVLFVQASLEADKNGHEAPEQFGARCKDSEFRVPRVHEIPYGIVVPSPRCSLLAG
jgi:hypothetical protein